MTNINNPDADTVDGQHASAFVADADHDKALHDGLGIDADTVDGQHASELGNSDADIQEVALIHNEGFAPGFGG